MSSDCDGSSYRGRNTQWPEAQVSPGSQVPSLRHRPRSAPTGTFDLGGGGGVFVVVVVVAGGVVVVVVVVVVAGGAVVVVAGAGAGYGYAGRCIL